MPDADDDDGAAGDERPDADGGPLPCACVYARLAWREKWLSDGEAACLTGALFSLPQSSKFFHSLSITSIFNRLHGVLNVGKK
jgi:hypothetical protein